jgi:hypothetical protein
MDIRDLPADPIGIGLTEIFVGRQIEPTDAELLGDGEALATKIILIDRLGVNGHEEGARFDATARQLAAQLVAAAAERRYDADGIFRPGKDPSRFLYQPRRRRRAATISPSRSVWARPMAACRLVIR